MELGGKKMIFAIIEAACGFLGEITVAIPFVMDLTGSLGASEKKGSGAREGYDFDAVLDELDVHLPIPGVRGRMKVAVIDERLQIHFDGGARPDQRVLNVSRTFALPHPHALFEKRIR